MKADKILDSVLEDISLSKKELSKISSIAKEVALDISRVGKVKALIGGSLAKGTVVRKEGKQDVDIFVVFDYSEDILGLENILKKIKLPGKLKRVHGSRDYFQIVCSDVVLEIIPVVKNSDPGLAENVTDVSLRHVRYVKKKIGKNKRLAEEIKLAKVFCRANGIYGAESYIRGFSGYSLEILVIYFGSFIKMLKGLVRLAGKGKIVLDPEKYFKNSSEVLSELNSSKLRGPIVLVDPTYNYRNVCAGLGYEAFEHFLDISKKFLKFPSADFFDRKDLDISKIKSYAKKKGARFLELDIRTNRQEGDIAGTKMKRFFDFIVVELEKKEQKVLKKFFDYSGNGKKAKGILVVLEFKEIEVRGPPISNKEGVKAFKKTHGKSVFKKKGYFWVKEKIVLDSLLKKSSEIGKEMGAWLV